MFHEEEMIEITRDDKNVLSTLKFLFDVMIPLPYTIKQKHFNICNKFLYVSKACKVRCKIKRDLKIALINIIILLYY